MLYLTTFGHSLNNDLFNCETSQEGTPLGCVGRTPNACEMGRVVERLNERKMATTEEPTGANVRAIKLIV